MTDNPARFIIPANLFQTYDISACEMSLLFALLGNADPSTGIATVSQRELSKQVSGGIAANAQRRQRLCEVGLLEVVQAASHLGPMSYRFPAFTLVVP